MTATYGNGAVFTMGRFFLEGANDSDLSSIYRGSLRY